MNSNQRRCRSFQICLQTASAALVCALLGSQLVQAQTYKVLYSFRDSPDGALAGAALIKEAQGNLYGTTDVGGTSGCGSFGQGCGVVFKLSNTGKESVEYAFAGGNEGVNPYYAGVVRDTQGNLCGTTLAGGRSGAGIVFGDGAFGYGTVFKIRKGAKRSCYTASKATRMMGTAPSEG
jgi:hypothetical protein